MHNSHGSVIRNLRIIRGNVDIWRWCHFKSEIVNRTQICRPEQNRSDTHETEYCSAIHNRPHTCFRAISVAETIQFIRHMRRNWESACNRKSISINQSRNVQFVSHQYVAMTGLGQPAAIASTSIPPTVVTDPA